MHDLASYGIHFREIKDTILWVCKLEVLHLPDLHPSSVNSVIDSLTDSHGPALNMNDPDPDFVILADPENMIATATAYVLWGLLDPHFFTQGLGSCIVLNEGADLPAETWSQLGPSLRQISMGPGPFGITLPPNRLTCSCTMLTMVVSAKGFKSWWKPPSNPTI